jgi:hypothetical protein
LLPWVLQRKNGGNIFTTVNIACFLKLYKPLQKITFEIVESINKTYIKKNGKAAKSILIGLVPKIANSLAVTTAKLFYSKLIILSSF